MNGITNITKGRVKAKLMASCLFIAASLLPQAAMAVDDGKENVLWFVPDGTSSATGDGIEKMIGAFLSMPEAAGVNLTVIGYPSLKNYLDVDLPEKPLKRAKVAKFYTPIMAKVDAMTEELVAAGEAKIGAPDTVVDDIRIQSLFNELPKYASRSSKVMIIGALQEFNPAAANENTLHQFPSVGVLDLPFDRVAAGAGGLEGGLAGLKVFHCATGGDFVLPMLEAQLEKYEALKVARMGGELFISRDLDGCMERMIEGDTSGMPAYQEEPGVEPAFLTIENVAVAPQTIPQAEQLAKVDAMAGAGDISADQAEALKKQVVSGTARIISLHVSDDAGQDHDIVRLFCGTSWEKTIELTNAGVTIEAPICESKLSMQGIYDGGGSITVSVASEDGRKVFSPRMMPGDYAEIPFVQ